MYPENPEGTRVIVGSVNKGHVSDTARNQTRNLFRTKCAQIPSGHSDTLSSLYNCILSTEIEKTNERKYERTNKSTNEWMIEQTNGHLYTIDRTNERRNKRTIEHTADSISHITN